MKSKTVRDLPLSTLRRYRGKLLYFEKEAVLFKEHDRAFNYYQVHTGSIKLFQVTNNSHEFIHGIVHEGQGIGMTSIIGKIPYLNNASALEAAAVWQMPARFFLRMLKENPGLLQRLSQLVCKELEFKSLLLQKTCCSGAEHQLQFLFHHLASTSPFCDESSTVVISYTRQQLANMLGLRVETVIRAVKSMEEKGLLTIRDGHKIIFRSLTG